MSYAIKIIVRAPEGKIKPVAALTPASIMLSLWGGDDQEAAPPFESSKWVKIDSAGATIGGTQ
jgi:hypothetical protein